MKGKAVKTRSVPAERCLAVLLDGELVRLFRVDPDCEHLRSFTRDPAPQSCTGNSGRNTMSRDGQPFARYPD